MCTFVDKQGKMGITANNANAKFFEVRLKVGGNRRDEIRKIVEGKKGDGNFKKNTDAVEAIIIEYGRMVEEKKKSIKK